MGTSLLRRLLHPTMLLHLILWLAALLATVLLFGRLWPSRIYDFFALVFAIFSLFFIGWYWVKGIGGLYGLLVTYILLLTAAVVATVNNLGPMAVGLHWIFADLLLTLPIYEVYTLIAGEKESAGDPPPA